MTDPNDRPIPAAVAKTARDIAERTVRRPRGASIDDKLDADLAACPRWMNPVVEAVRSASATLERAKSTAAHAAIEFCEKDPEASDARAAESRLRKAVAELRSAEASFAMMRELRAACMLGQDAFAAQAKEFAQTIVPSPQVAPVETPVPDTTPPAED